MGQSKIKPGDEIMIKILDPGKYDDPKESPIKSRHNTSIEPTVIKKITSYPTRSEQRTIWL